MARVEFDDGAAERLSTALTFAADALRAQAGTRRSAVEHAVDEFKGTYSDRFLEAARIEASDRPKLEGVLVGLADVVAVVADEADRERQRQEDLAAWQKREAHRQREAATDPISSVKAWGEGVFDPRPSGVPIRPTPIAASFSARARYRSGGGTGGGRSSAKPGNLRSFARSARATDRATQAKLASLRSAWNGFVSSCPWARIESATFLIGFDDLLAENAADAAWMDEVADAFDRAGSGRSLANAALDIAVAGRLPAALRKALRPDLDPSEIAELWQELPWAARSKTDEADLAALPLPVLAQIGNLEGAPYWARNIANVAVLNDRISEAKRTSSGNLGALDEIKWSLKGSEDAPRFLVSLSADEPPLAAVSIGDLDTAPNVTWAVPGMGSSTKEMTDWTNAAQNLYDAQGDVAADRPRAVIAWQGYKSPPIPVQQALDLGVLGTEAAQPGGDLLATSVLGLTAARAGDMPMTNVAAHSYGTTTAAFGLTHDGVHVDTFTTFASAGIPDSIPDVSALHAGHVYAGQARNVWPIEKGAGDQYAALGRDKSHDHQQDPTDSSFGATAFGADGDDGELAVTDHGVHVEEEGSGYLDPGTESLHNIALTTTGQGGSVTPYIPKGPTPYEQAVLDSLHSSGAR